METMDDNEARRIVNAAIDKISEETNGDRVASVKCLRNQMKVDDQLWTALQMRWERRIAYDEIHDRISTKRSRARKGTSHKAPKPDRNLADGGLDALARARAEQLSAKKSRIA